MSLIPIIPRVLKSRMMLLGINQTQLGERIGTNCDVAGKKITAAGRDLRVLELLCNALAITVDEVVQEAAEIRHKAWVAEKTGKEVADEN